MTDERKLIADLAEAVDDILAQVVNDRAHDVIALHSTDDCVVRAQAAVARARALLDRMDRMPAEDTPVWFMAAASPTRRTDWGHWGLTFVEQIGDNWLIRGRAFYPVGPQGPVEGTVGSPERQRWLEMADAWVKHGVLPQ